MDKPTLDTPTENVTEQPTNQPVTPETPQRSSKLAIWSLVLGISSLVLAAFIFFSIPAAIAAIILGTVGLIKHHPGKGKNIAGIITGGVALLVIVALVNFAIDVLNSAKTDTSKTTKSTLTVNADCYTYAIPTGYVYEDASVACHTAVNYPKGDALTRIQVKGTTGTIGTLDEVVAQYNDTLKQADPSSKGVVDKEQFTANGKTVYYISFEDGLKLLSGVYIVKDPASTQTLDGEPIVGYRVLGYTYNSELKSVVRSVVDSLVTK